MSELLGFAVGFPFKTCVLGSVIVLRVWVPGFGFRFRRADF